MTRKARFSRNIGCFLYPVVLLGSLNTQAPAQTDAGGIFRPWPIQERHLEGTAEAILQGAGNTDRGDDQYQLSLYRSFGRWRLDDTRKLNPTLGYNLTFMDLGTDSPLLPEQLTDVSVGFGTPLHQFQNGWFLGITSAIGYAGNEPFNDGDAWYAKSTLLFGKELGNDSNIIFGLDYNGNRTVFPDLPLPGFAYTKRIDPKLLAVVGFPYSSVLWEPMERVRVEAGYTFPELYYATLSYEPVRPVRLFVDARNALMAFHLDNLPSRRRLFYQERRVEAGVRWQPYELLGVVAAVGYGFGQSFDIGWDSRDLTSVTDVSSEPYVRLAVEWRY